MAENSTYTSCQNQAGLNSILDVFSNFNYTPPANISQYGAEPYNTQAQLNTITNPAVFFTTPMQQAQTAINTVANSNTVSNSGVTGNNLPANNPISQIPIQSQNSVESVITNIKTALTNLFKDIFGQ